MAFLCAAFNCCKADDRIFGDTTSHKKFIIHYHFDAGVILRLGRDRVRTYNDYNHTTNNADYFVLGEYSRFIAVRMAHGIEFKKNWEAGLTYGADVYVQLHDVRAFVPVMLHVLNNTRITKKLALLFVERAGYAFYIRNKNYDPFISYPGVDGGFISETLVGISVQARHKNYLQVMLGYRFQHIYSKEVYSPDQTLVQQGGAYGNLPNAITEKSNGIYHFIYLSLGVPF